MRGSYGKIWKHRHCMCRNCDPHTKSAEAMAKFGLEFITDTARADTVAPDKKNAEAMLKFGFPSDETLNFFRGQKL